MPTKSKARARCDSRAATTSRSARTAPRWAAASTSSCGKRMTAPGACIATSHIRRACRRAAQRPGRMPARLPAPTAWGSRVTTPHCSAGSVLLMEFANPQRDGEEQLLRGAPGQPLKGEIAHIDVMRRGAGFGAMYGASRAGEWEFASYRPDGSTLIPPDKAEHCAACHLNAGAGKDFVFRTRSWNA